MAGQLRGKTMKLREINEKAVLRTNAATVEIECNLRRQFKPVIDINGKPHEKIWRFSVTANIPGIGAGQCQETVSEYAGHIPEVSAFVKIWERSSAPP